MFKWKFRIQRNQKHDDLDQKLKFKLIIQQTAGVLIKEFSTNQILFRKLWSINSVVNCCFMRLVPFLKQIFVSPSDHFFSCFFLFESIFQRKISKKYGACIVLLKSLIKALEQFRLDLEACSWLRNDELLNAQFQKFFITQGLKYCFEVERVLIQLGGLEGLEKLSSLKMLTFPIDNGSTLHQVP